MTFALAMLLVLGIAVLGVLANSAADSTYVEAGGSQSAIDSRPTSAGGLCDQIKAMMDAGAGPDTGEIGETFIWSDSQVKTVVRETDVCPRERDVWQASTDVYLDSIESAPTTQTTPPPEPEYAVTAGVPGALAEYGVDESAWHMFKVAALSGNYLVTGSDEEAVDLALPIVDGECPLINVDAKVEDDVSAGASSSDARQFWQAAQDLCL